MENRNQNESNDKLIISYELLQLMEWLCDYESEALKKIILKALKKGFDHQMKDSKNFKDFYSGDQMQNTIIDFLGLLEVLLFEANSEHQAENIIQKNMMPVVDHVDTNNFDSSLMKTSISVATNKYQRNPKENAQQLFLKELLKRWKPVKDQKLN